MNRFASVILLLFVLVGCQKSTPADSPELVALRARVAVLESEAQKPPAMPVESTSPKPAAYELLVTWPSEPANNYQRGYDDAQKCEAARRAIFEENDRREAENQAQVGKNGVIAVGSISKASAVCIAG